MEQTKYEELLAKIQELEFEFDSRLYESELKIEKLEEKLERVRDIL